MKEIKTDKSPIAVGPYSQAIESGNLIFCSGQIGIKPENAELASGEIEGQTKQAIENLRQILIEAGADLDSVLKTEVFLKNIDDFAIMNEIYAEAWNILPRPARATIEASRLPKGALVMISCIASKNNS